MLDQEVGPQGKEVDPERAGAAHSDRRVLGGGEVPFSGQDLGLAQLCLRPHSDLRGLIVRWSGAPGALPGRNRPDPHRNNTRYS